MRRLIALILLAATLLLPAASRAHLTANSEVTLTFTDHAVIIDAAMPAGDFALAAGAEATDDRRAMAWVVGQVGARSRDGRNWAVTPLTLTRTHVDGAAEVHVSIRLTPPAGANVRQLHLRWAPIITSNTDHFALILVGTDHGAGVLPQDRKLIGALRHPDNQILIDRGSFRQTAALGSAFRLGMHHIAEGADHLMFLLALLLPAPLVAARRRWGGPKPLRATLVTLLRIVTAFTIGHSITLVAAAVASWRLPPAPVEIAIALSILVSAVHAVRPIFAGREAWVATGFGLIHGLAFATLVGDAGLDGAARLLPILGFNLGIEAVQLLVVGAAMVPLALIVGLPVYRPIRWLLAIIAGLAAIGWIVERSIAAEFTLVSDWAAVGVGHAPAIWLGAVIIAGVCRLLSTRSRGTKDG